MATYEAIIDGLPMHWEEHGAQHGGTPVVFVHGIPTSPRLWRHVWPHLSGVHALAWEMVGYGQSMGASWGRDISVARQADHLVTWMDAIGLDHAVLVGHDLGGGVVQIAAVRHRRRVRGIVLTNAISYDSWPVPSVKALQLLSPLVARLPAALLAPVFALLFFRGHETMEQTREAFSVHFPLYHRPGGADAFARQIEALDVRDTLAIADQLDTLDLPAQIVWGAADPFQKIAYGERLARDLGAPLDRIEGGTHFVPEDHPERIARAVRAVLQQQ